MELVNNMVEFFKRHFDVLSCDYDDMSGVMSVIIERNGKTYMLGNDIDGEGYWATRYINYECEWENGIVPTLDDIVTLMNKIEPMEY